MSSAQRLVRLRAEIESIKKNPSPGIFVYWENPDFIEDIKVEMTGPERSPFENQIFTLKVSIPERYPFTPPGITFLSKIYHPNIDPNGRICLEALKPKPTGTWNVTLNIITVLASIRILLLEPNLSDPLMAEIAKEYSETPDKYFKNARAFSLNQLSQSVNNSTS